MIIYVVLQGIMLEEYIICDHDAILILYALKYQYYN